MLDASLDELDRVQGLRIDDAVAQHRDTETNTAERIANIMGDLCRRLSDCGKRFTSTECALSFCGLSRIHERHDLSAIAVDRQWRRIDVECLVFILNLCDPATMVSCFRHANSRYRFQHLHCVVGSNPFE